MKEFKTMGDAFRALNPQRFYVFGSRIRQLTTDEWTEEERAAIEFLIDDYGCEFDSPTIK